ncbi:SNF2 domain-containing protein CLASSY 3 [Morus notabilis]|uniref:SNF2 domain-containing protein CLASSY 3 n=1 Tax=Morus notabilis TaxID=981085 RepID=UPI000CED39C1|nr:SNF2 domain-containing protein CLASSY 3 [Morus notabilis]
MDRNLPVARRTRLQEEEAFRKLFEATTKKKKDKNQKKTNGRACEGGTASDKRQDFASSSGSRSSRFAVEKENSGISNVHVKKNCSISLNSVEKDNVERGTEDSPFCIDDDDDDLDFTDCISEGEIDNDGDDDEEEGEEEWIPSSEDEGGSGKDRRMAKHRKTEKGSISRKSDSHEINESEDDGIWVTREDDDDDDENSTQEREKTNVGTPFEGEEVEVLSSDGDESEDDEEKVHNDKNSPEVCDKKMVRKNENEKSNAGTCVEEEAEEVSSSDGDEDQENVKRRKRGESSENGRSDDDGGWTVSETDEEKEKSTNLGTNSVRASEPIEIEITSSSDDEGESFQVEEEDEDESEQDCSVSSAENTNSIAQRTRSRRGKLKKELRSARTSSFDEDEDGESTEMCVSNEQRKKGSKKPTARKQKCTAEARNKKEQELIRRGTKRKLKRREAGYDVFQILVDSIYETGQVCVEDLESNKDETAMENVDRSVLPLKFTFGIEKPNTPEKSKEELEIDELWAEMDLAGTYDGIGFCAANVVEDEDPLPSWTGIDKYNLCNEAPERKHRPKLEEEIGLICSYCSKEEKNPSGRLDIRDLRKSDCSFFDELGFHDSDCESHSSNGVCDRAETVWDLIPGVKSSMYPHQREGFEFIWKHIAGGIHLENFESIENYAGGEGCIISHAPGTGKSRLTIVFLQTFMKLHPKCLPLIIAPRSMLLTWEEEFRKWKVDIPFHNLNIDDLSGKEDKKALALLRKASCMDKDAIRIVKLYSWKKGGSILAISYTLFEKLVSGQNKANDKYFRKILLELPGLLVLDEGHTPRNNQSLIWQALSNIKTHRRILLSGTPFQNNFNELFNTMCIVKKDFSETIGAAPSVSCGIRLSSKEKTRKQWSDLTKSIGKSAGSQMDLTRLKSIIDPLVHIHRGDVLEKSLPGLRESVIVLKPLELQRSLLQEIEAEKSQQFVFENAVSLTSVHPSLLLESKSEASHVKINELKRLRSNPDAGVKTKFLMELIKLSTAMNERVLVFSEYLSSLSLMKEYLIAKFGWTEKEVLYIDGKCDIKERQCAINKFNDMTSEAKVVLASIKACGEGINLVGASRVVLLDVVWNPSLEKQATRRAYRLGQKKVVYVYYLIASGTMEEDKHSRQAEKKRLSKLVFTSSDSVRNEQKSHSRVTEDTILELMVQHESLKPIFERISFKQKESNLMETSFFEENQPMVSSESDL